MRSCGTLPILPGSEDGGFEETHRAKDEGLHCLGKSQQAGQNLPVSGLRWSVFFFFLICFFGLRRALLGKRKAPKGCVFVGLLGEEQLMFAWVLANLIFCRGKQEHGE